MAPTGAIVFISILGIRFLLYRHSALIYYVCGYPTMRSYYFLIDRTRRNKKILETIGTL